MRRSGWRLLGALGFAAAGWLGACAPESPPARGSATGRAADPASRIVSFVPGATDILLGLDPDADRFVGRVTGDDARLGHLPSIGGVLRPSLEALAAVAPDLVVTWSGADTVDLRRAVGRDARIVVVELDGLSDVLAAVDAFGAHLGELERARAISRGLRADARRLAAELSDAPSVPALWVVGAEPLTVAGAGTFIDELLSAAGGANVMRTDEGAWPQPSREVLAVREFEVIIAPLDLDLPDLGVDATPVIRIDPGRFHVAGRHVVQAARELAGAFQPFRLPPHGVRRD